MSEGMTQGDPLGIASGIDTPHSAASCQQPCYASAAGGE